MESNNAFGPTADEPTPDEPTADESNNSNKFREKGISLKYLAIGAGVGLLLSQLFSCNLRNSKFSFERSFDKDSTEVVEGDYKVTLSHNNSEDNKTLKFGTKIEGDSLSVTCNGTPLYSGKIDGGYDAVIQYLDNQPKVSISTMNKAFSKTKSFFDQLKNFYSNSDKPDELTVIVDDNKDYRVLEANYSY